MEQYAEFFSQVVAVQKYGTIPYEWFDDFICLDEYLFII